MILDPNGPNKTRTRSQLSHHRSRSLGSVSKESTALVAVTCLEYRLSFRRNRVLARPHLHRYVLAIAFKTLLVRYRR
jgi:hypothetical protein